MGLKSIPKVLRKKALKKSTKKPKDEVLVSEEVLSETCADNGINGKCQTLPSREFDENKAAGVRSGKIRLNGTEKKRAKKEVKQRKKPLKEKVNVLPQKVPSDDGNIPSRRPSSSSSQEYGSELSTAGFENNSENQNPHRSYSAESPKKNRKTSRNGAVRRSKNRSRSKSPMKMATRSADYNSQNTEDINDSSEDKTNASSKQSEIKNIRKESPSKQRHAGNKRSRSPVNSNQEEDNSNKKSKTETRKRSVSPGRRSQNETRSNSDNGIRNSERSPVAKRGASPKSQDPKSDKHDTPEKKHSAKISKKLKGSPSRLPNRNARQKNLSRGGTKKGFGRSKSRRPSFKTSRIRKGLSKRRKSPNSRLGSKDRVKKALLRKKLASGPKALSRKKASPGKRKSVTKGKSKSKVRKSVRRGITRRITRRKSQKSNARRKK